MLATYARQTREILTGLSFEGLARGEIAFSPAPEVQPQAEVVS